MKFSSKFAVLWTAFFLMGQAQAGNYCVHSDACATITLHNCINMAARAKTVEQFPKSSSSYSSHLYQIESGASQSDMLCAHPRDNETDKLDTRYCIISIAYLYGKNAVKDVHFDLQKGDTSFCLVGDATKFESKPCHSCSE